jgi:hypothetical protein
MFNKNVPNYHAHYHHFLTHSSIVQLLIRNFLRLVLLLRQKVAQPMQSITRNNQPSSHNRLAVSHQSLILSLLNLAIIFTQDVLLSLISNCYRVKDQRFAIIDELIRGFLDGRELGFEGGESRVAELVGFSNVR